MAIQFFNGEFLPQEAIQFSINDVGILRGYGIFDFFRVINQVPVFMEDNLKRFEQSARIMGMPPPYSREKTASVIQELIDINAFETGYIKMVMTGGETSDGFSPGKPNLAILNHPLVSPSETLFTKGISLMTYDYTRDFPEAKSIHYAMAVRLQKYWKPAGHEDVLYHAGGTVSEVSRSNVFFFKGNQLITNEEGVLIGVTRKKVLMLAKVDYEIVIRDFTLDELLAADEVFMTSTNKEVMPIVKLDDKVIANGKPGAKTRALLAGYRRYVEDYVNARKGATHSIS